MVGRLSPAPLTRSNNVFFHIPIDPQISYFCAGSFLFSLLAATPVPAAATAAAEAGG